MGIRSLLAAAGLALAFTAPAAAQDYPNKPVRIVVPFAPGGINDVAARLLAQHLSEKLGKQFIAENMPGGGGISATERVIHSAARRLQHPDPVDRQCGASLDVQAQV